MKQASRPSCRFSPTASRPCASGSSSAARERSIIDEMRTWSARPQRFVLASIDEGRSR